MREVSINQLPKTHENNRDPRRPKITRTLT
jgi:hypothetical protein